MHRSIDVSTYHLFEGVIDKYRYLIGDGLKGCHKGELYSSSIYLILELYTTCIVWIWSFSYSTFLPSFI